MLGKTDKLERLAIRQIDKLQIKGINLSIDQCNYESTSTDQMHEKDKQRNISL